jgi:hypothetical protein
VKQTKVLMGATFAASLFALVLLASMSGSASAEHSISSHSQGPKISRANDEVPIVHMTDLKPGNSGQVGGDQQSTGDDQNPNPPRTATPTRSRTPTITSTPTTCPGAFHYFRPQGGTPQNGGTVRVGEKFTLDMMINPGQYAVGDQEAYYTFTNQIIQNVNANMPRSRRGAYSLAIFTTGPDQPRHRDTGVQRRFSTCACLLPGLGDTRGRPHQHPDAHPYHYSGLDQYAHTNSNADMPAWTGGRGQRADNIR